MRPDLRHRRAQAGFAGAMIIALLLILGSTFTLWFVARASDAANAKKIIRTREVLALARDALITFAASNPDRGYLPCPAIPPPNSPGIAQNDCVANGLRIGRLPWRTLQLPDLQDGNGDSLWYAVSASFTNDATKINSAISNGALSIDGGSGVVAIVFSPGKILDGQSRAATVVHCSTIGSNLRADYCAANFLDVNTTSGVANGDANTSFTRGAGGDFNDELLGISADELLPKLEARVLGEVNSCLLAYSLRHPSNRFPWARPDTGDPFDATAPYSEVAGTTNGRVPDSLLTTSNYWQSPPALPHCPLPRCAVSGACTATKNWLTDWRDLIFYVVARPDATLPTTVTVNTPAAVSAPAAILIAGAPLTGTPCDPQVRSSTTDGNTPCNYLEGLNLSTYAAQAKVWETTSTSSPFNDRVQIVAP